MLNEGWKVELEKKDKIIDKMADLIRKRHENWISREEVKEYFKKESEKK